MNDFYKYTSDDKFYGGSNPPAGMLAGETGWIEFAFGGTYMPNPKWGGNVPIFVAKNATTKPPKDILLPNGDILLTDGTTILKSSDKMAMIMSFLATEQIPLYPTEMPGAPIPAKYNVTANLNFPITGSNGIKLQENGDIDYPDGSKFQRAYSWIIKPDGSRSFDINKLNDANAVYPVHYGGTNIEVTPGGHTDPGSGSDTGSGSGSGSDPGSGSGSDSESKIPWGKIGIGVVLAGLAAGAIIKFTGKKKPAKKRKR